MKDTLTKIAQQQHVVYKPPWHSSVLGVFTLFCISLMKRVFGYNLERYGIQIPTGKQLGYNYVDRGRINVPPQLSYTVI